MESSLPSPPLQAAPTPPAASPAVPAVNSSAIRLPIVRILFKGARPPQLVAIYDDHIVMGFCRRNYSLTEPMLAVDGEAQLTGQLRKLRRIDFNDVAAIKIHPGRLLHYFKLHARSGTRMQFSLPKNQAGHVGQFLRAKLADRVPFRRLRAGIATGVLVVLLGLVVGLAAMDLMAFGQRGFGTLLGILGLGVTVAGLWLLFGRGAVVTHSAEDKTLPVPTPFPARHAVTVAKPPLRSKPLGWTLKLLGLAYWFVVFGPVTDPLQAWLNANLQDSVQAQSFIWTLLWFPAPLLIFTGYRLCQRRYIPKQGDDSRKPILFLRPFQDDEHTSLQPSGATAKATGIRSRSAYTQSGKTDLFDLLWSAHPIRVLRMIADYGTGSSEESIARYFERHGPVIAIGKPGEHLASPGAARMYLTDATWQDAILCEMQRAQAVVIQPAPSEGVRWELTHIREKVAPGRVLLCLVSYWNNPEYYEDLTSVVADTLQVQLPRVIPYLRRPAFVYFDEQWNPHVQELSYKDPVLWPITSDGADLHYSLSGFVEGMQGGKTQPPRPARWIGGPKVWAASFAAVVIAVILIVVPNTLIAISGEAIKMATGGISILSSHAQIAKAVAGSPRIVLQGRSVAYQIKVPEAMAAVQTTDALVEQFRRTPDERFEVEVITDPHPEDLSDMPQQRLDACKAGGADARLDAQRTFQQDGVNWVESHITVTPKGGLPVEEIARGASTPHATALIVMHIVESPDTDATYQALAEETLQSFHFGDSASQ